MAVDSQRGIWIGVASKRGLSQLVTEISEFAGSTPEEGIPPIKLGEELEFAMLDRSFQLPAAFRRLVMLASQAIAREFGWRLPGFSKSSLPYLFDNFLDFTAKVEIEEARFLVHLQNPPLHLVLSLTGMNRKQFLLAATGGKEWVLTQAS